MKRPTEDDLGEIYSIFGDLRNQGIQEWWARNKGEVEDLEIDDIPIGDLHGLAERIREWKKKKSN
jgi:hypothetical protein